MTLMTVGKIIFWIEVASYMKHETYQLVKHRHGFWKELYKKFLLPLVDGIMTKNWPSLWMKMSPTQCKFQDAQMASQTTSSVRTIGKNTSTHVKVESLIQVQYQRENNKIIISTGDSGSGLIVHIDDDAYVHGISSFGLSCNTRLPSFYTRVSSYIDWIEQTVWGWIKIEDFISREILFQMFCI